MADEARLNGLANEQYIEHCCQVLHFDQPKYQNLVDAIKIEALKTLASVVFLEKQKKF